MAPRRIWQEARKAAKRDGVLSCEPADAACWQIRPALRVGLRGSSASSASLRRWAAIAFDFPPGGSSPRNGRRHGDPSEKSGLAGAGSEIAAVVGAQLGACFVIEERQEGVAVALGHGQRLVQ